MDFVHAGAAVCVAGDGERCERPRACAASLGMRAGSGVGGRHSAPDAMRCSVQGARVGGFAKLMLLRTVLMDGCAAHTAPDAMRCHAHERALLAACLTPLSHHERRNAPPQSAFPLRTGAPLASMRCAVVVVMSGATQLMLLRTVLMAIRAARTASATNRCHAHECAVLARDLRPRCRHERSKTLLPPPPPSRLPPSARRSYRSVSQPLRPHAARGGAFLHPPGAAKGRVARS